MRFSLLALIGCVALAAVGCAALVNANDVWLVAVSTLTFAIVMASSLIGLLGRGWLRGFAIGFTFCCAAYLALVYFGLANENAGVGRIATTRALNRIYSAVETQGSTRTTTETVTKPPNYPGANPVYPRTTGPVYPGAKGPRYPTGPGSYAPAVYNLSGGTAVVGPNPTDRDTFMQIGQQLWALLIGCLGGVFATWLWRPAAPRTNES